MRSAAFFFLTIFFSAVTLRAQSPDTILYQITDQMPQFPGGQDAMMQFISKHITYPSLAREAEIEGRVVATFVVNTDGTISDIKIMRSPGYGMSEEVIRMLKLMPAWSPGKMKGEPVRVQFNLPVVFRLEQRRKKPRGNN